MAFVTLSKNLCSKKKTLPRTVASVLAGGDGLALRDILRASAELIQSVYHTRWTYGHKFGQSD